METWISQSIDRGGRIGFLAKLFLSLPCISISHNFYYYDHLTISLTQQHKSISIIVIYRPLSPKPEFSSFLSEITDITTDLISSPTYHPIILSDFNYHFNAASNQHIMFSNLTNSLSLSQHVNLPAHINYNIIDLVFSRSLKSELIVSNIYRLDLFPITSS